MNRRMIVMVICLAFLTGCTMPIYKGGIKPVYPGVKTFGRMYETVETLTPTFKWESDAASACTYDFAIWDVGETIPHGTGAMVTKGPTLYYKEALTRPEHTVEIPLGPDTLYFWSVRTRCNGQVSAWAVFDYHQWLVIAAAKGSSWPYSFKTPKPGAQ